MSFSSKMGPIQSFKCVVFGVVQSVQKTDRNRMPRLLAGGHLVTSHPVRQTASPTPSHQPAIARPATPAHQLHFTHFFASSRLAPTSIPVVVLSCRRPIARPPPRRNSSPFARRLFHNIAKLCCINQHDRVPLTASYWVLCRIEDFAVVLFVRLALDLSVNMHLLGEARPSMA